MSSLLQHHRGVESNGKVQLLAYQVEKTEKWYKYNGPESNSPSPDSTTFTDNADLTEDGYPFLWEFYRKPKGMWGNWVVFRWNNEDHVPDLSVPMSMFDFQMPRDARKLSAEESAKHWKS